MTSLLVPGFRLPVQRPAVIVSVLSGPGSRALAEARAMRGTADLLEWRLDPALADGGTRGGAEPEEFARQVAALAPEMSEAAGSIPVLVTIRTSREGGHFAGDDETYAEFLLALVRAGGFQLLDVEAYRGRALVDSVIRACDAAQILTVGSFHSFEATPPEDEMIERLRFMHEDLGATIAKLAVMPHSPHDVLAVLGATAAAAGTRPDRPVITMAMGPSGAVTRLGGHVFGSAATFGAGAAASAPGQLPSALVREILERVPRFPAPDPVTDGTTSN